MTTPRSLSLLTASLVLTGATALGCGGGGAPTDASEKEFCDNLNSLYDDLGGMADATDKERIATIKDWGKSLEKVGTPKAMSDEERQGFEVIVKQIDDVDEDGSTADLDKMEKDLSKSDKEASDAFQQYTSDTCGEVGGTTP